VILIPVVAAAVVEEMAAAAATAVAAVVTVVVVVPIQVVDHHRNVRDDSHIVDPNLVELDVACDGCRIDTCSSVDPESARVVEYGWESTNTILDPGTEGEHYYNIYTSMLPCDLERMGTYLVEEVQVVPVEGVGILDGDLVEVEDALADVVAAAAVLENTPGDDLVEEVVVAEDHHRYLDAHAVKGQMHSENVLHDEELLVAHSQV